MAHNKACETLNQALWNIKYLPWLSYKEEVIVTRGMDLCSFSSGLPNETTALIHPGGDHLPSYKHVMVGFMCP